MQVKTPPSALASGLLDQSERVFAGQLPRLEDVAAAVGVSRATLYYYFSGHDDLRSYLIAEHVHRGAAVISSANSVDGAAGPRLRATLAAMVRYLGERPGFCSGLLASSGSSGELGAVLQLNDAEIAAPLRALLAEGVEAGEFDIADVHAATDAMLGAVLFAVLGRSRQAGAPLDDDFAEGIARQLLSGIAPAATPGRSR